MDVRVVLEGRDDVLVSVPTGCLVAEFAAEVRRVLGDAGGDGWECVSDGVPLADADELPADAGVIDVRPTAKHMAQRALEAQHRPLTEAGLRGALEEGAAAAAVVGQYVRAEVVDPEVLGTLLLEQCAHGRHGGVAVLLHEGVDPNACDADGATALFHAAEHGDAELCGALLRHGADPGAVSRLGYTALIVAAERGHTEACLEILKSGADVNYQTRRNRWTALMFAAMNADAILCYALVAAGADVNRERSDGATALMLAAARGCQPLADYFISCGADVNAFTMLL